MRRKLTKIALATLLASIPLTAGDIDLRKSTKSIFAIEGGYSVTDVVSNAGTKNTENFGGLGLKLGAEVNNYRVFIAGRVYSIDGFDYAYTYGGELQYLFNFSEVANFFIGANAGMAIMRKSTDTPATDISVDDPYYGADLGFNFHVNEMIDIELGARGMQINNFENIVTGYTSLIIKYDMD